MGLRAIVIPYKHSEAVMGCNVDGQGGGHKTVISPQPTHSQSAASSSHVSFPDVPSGAYTEKLPQEYAERRALRVN